MASLISNTATLSVELPTPIASGFGSGSDVGSYANNVWAPGRDASGLVNAASWATVPSGRWVRVVGSNMSALIPTIQASIAGWTDPQSPDWVNCYLTSWGGVAMDYQGGHRLWYCTGGHGAGSNNGIYRFDAFKMKWAVESLPDNLADPVNAGIYDNGFSPSVVAQVQAEYAAGTLKEENGVWADQYPSGKLVHTHTYNNMVHAPNLNRLMFMRYRFWSFNLATGQWDYKKVSDWGVDMPSRLAHGFQPTSAAGVKYALGRDSEHGIAIWDETANKYFHASYGSSGIGGTITFDWNSKSFAYSTYDPAVGVTQANKMNAAYPETGSVRVGRKLVTVTSGVAPPNSYARLPSYSVFDLDTNSLTTGVVQGVSTSDFSRQPSAYDGTGLCYIGSINRYWVWMPGPAWASGGQAAVGDMLCWELNPTTTPWTMTQKTFTGDAPQPFPFMGSKQRWMSAINAVVHVEDGGSMMYVYKL